MFFRSVCVFLSHLKRNKQSTMKKYKLVTQTRTKQTKTKNNDMKIKIGYKFFCEMGVLSPKSEGLKNSQYSSGQTQSRRSAFKKHNNSSNDGEKPFQRTIPSSSHYQYRSQKNKNKNKKRNQKNNCHNSRLVCTALLITAFCYIH